MLNEGRRTPCQLARWSAGQPYPTEKAKKFGEKNLKKSQATKK